MRLPDHRGDGGSLPGDGPISWSIWKAGYTPGDQRRVLLQAGTGGALRLELQVGIGRRMPVPHVNGYSTGPNIATALFHKRWGSVRSRYARR